MDAGFKLNKDNPRNRSNILSKLFFTWLIKLFYKGTQKGLQILDLYKVLSQDQSEMLSKKLENNWHQEVKKAKLLKKSSPSLLKALIKTFIWKYATYGLSFFVIAVVFRPTQPVILAYLLRLLDSPGQDNNQTIYILAGLIVIASFLTALMTHHTDLGAFFIGMRVRVAVSSLIYRKILRLNQKSLGGIDPGQVINLLSNDVSRFDMVTMFLHYFWIIPIQTVFITYLIWREVGISALTGVLSMAFLTLPVQGYLGKLTSSVRLAVAERTDTRVKLMNEVISGIQVIKMYAWEKPFEKIINLTRKNEIKYLTKASYLRGIYQSCMVFIERTTLYLTVISYVLLGNGISADIVFSLAQFFNLLQLSMAIYYPSAISYTAESLVSIKRLEAFLTLDEQEASPIEKSEDNDVVLKDVEASWVPDSPVLRQINLVIPSGTLCAVVGPVGAGKSSLLQLLLGELTPAHGSIKFGGRSSYASQNPWLFAGTVRNNILFGEDYDKAYYKEIVKVCALEKDFQQFPLSDRTMVGERGASLSGGQRARINLARAIYRRADLYLLDDPLSAVDTRVGKHLFNECIMRYLKGKTRILVTHQLQYLRRADLIVVINDKGRIEAQGTFEEISRSNLDFTKLLVAADETSDKEHATTNVLVPDRKQSITSFLSLTSELGDANCNDDNDEDVKFEGKSAFKEYISASGNFCALFSLISILIIGQVACNGGDYWVTYWTQQETTRRLMSNIGNLEEIVVVTIDNQTDQLPTNYNWYDQFTDDVIVNGEVHQLLKTNVYIYIYTVLITTAIVVTLIRSFAFFKMAMIASRNLHNTMFHALLKAPMKFFDTNPSGRILNRFSKDMGSIDELLPRVLLEALQILLVMGGILVLVSVSNYYMIIAIILVGAFFLKVRTWFIMTAKDIKHLEGITKSPVFSHLNSSLHGITTIRACNAENILQIEFDNHQDVHTSAWFLTLVCKSAFGLWLDMICILFVGIVTFSFVLLNQYGQASGSIAGLAISQSLILTGMLQYGVKQTAEVINQLTSVERVLQYTKLEDENEELSLIEKVPELPWPSKGLIEFANLSLRYSDNEPPVLKNLNLQIVPGNKVGIVGRTGAGKSSLISALFRLAPIDGSIRIDSVDTKTINLAILRRKIAIIPQEPVLFSASMRYNLDPFNEFDDDKLWNVLDEVELKDSISSLDFMVSGGGANFSLGQRQLICLARAILKNSKILVLDEATANVDPKTDSLIQVTIREKFANCTVLTIAHRLNTIMDSDKVLVMDAGSIVEYDHPHILLQNANGYFHRMVLETGPHMTQQLKDISQKFYLNTINEV